MDRRLWLALTCLLPAAALAQITYTPPMPPPNPMVWQQGINNAENWRLLGCPRDYVSDDDKNDMIGRGLCRNVNPDGTPRGQEELPLRGPPPDDAPKDR